MTWQVKKYSIFDDCVAYYDFSKNALDVIGENNGTVDGGAMGATITNDRFNKVNCCYSFDGINDRIYLESNPIVGDGSFTFSLWFKTINAFNGISFWFGDYSTNAGIANNINGSTGQVDVRVYDGPTIVATSTGYTDGTWGMLTITYDESDDTIKAYFNDGSPGSGTSALNLGSDYKFIGGDGSTSWFNGSLGEHIFWNRVLSADEVKQLYYLTKNKVIHPIVRGGGE